MSFLIHHYLQSYADKHPHNEAVSCLDKKMSYQALDEKSNQLAHTLIEQGIEVGDRVGIYMDKSIETAIALYGILKAGGVYVPLDPNAPSSRLIDIVNDCDITILISHNKKLSQLHDIAQAVKTSIVVIGLNQEQAQFETKTWQSIFSQASTEAPQRDIIESDLAYIIYTSGSTGVPKGIMHTHHSCLSYVRWAAKEVNLSHEDRLGNHCPLHFDISIFDWFAAIVAGASVVIIPEMYTKMPASYSELLATSKITVLFTVPFALIQMSEYGDLENRDLGHLRFVFFGGEPMHVKHMQNLMKQLPHVVFDNMYGPAETNGCTHYRIEKLDSDANAIPIGRMFEISQCLIVDENNEVLGSNEMGELLVRTPTMMQGYWARPDLNSKVFFHRTGLNGIDQYYKQSFYRTGDLVKMDEQGIMWFIGRKDRQVKVRGYRVELDEIEAALVSHDAVEEGAAFVAKQSDGNTEIYASFTLKEGETLSSKDISKHLKSKLPSYALPSILNHVQDFPRTSSDKIDRKELSKEASVCQSHKAI